MEAYNFEVTATRYIELCALAGIASVLLTGCYLSHGVDADRDAGRDGGRDAATPGPIDAGRRRDAGRMPDAGPVACERLVFVSNTRLDDPPGGVTPRLVALPGGDVGVVYVLTDGSPTRVVYQQLTAGLVALTPPITVATDSFTWAEPAVIDDTIAVAYGRAGDTESALVRIRFDGAPTGAPRATVPLHHPSILLPTREGLFWVAFAMRSENALELAHVDGSGVVISHRAEIPLGRYGSGHGAIAIPGWAAHVVTYPREGPPGVRQGYARWVDEAAALGPERLLGDEGDRAVVPVAVSGGVTFVRSGEQLILERVDPDAGFEPLEQATHPGIANIPLVTAVRGRLLVAHVVSNALAIDDFGTGITSFERVVAALPPGTSIASTGSAVAVRDGAVFALTLVEGATTYPWLVRLQCDAAP